MNQKTVVVYKSKTGFAKRYAEWIAEALQCDLKENAKMSLEDIIHYDTIIYGGGLYAVGINGINLIKNNYDALKDKNLVVFATGVTPPREDDMVKVREMNFTEEQRKTIKFFYFRGGFNFSKLNMGNKILMTMMKSKLKNEKTPSDDERDMLEAIDKPVDFTDRNNILPLIKYVEGIK
ncbi:MAG: flavodoxin domain-containing protein [Clostridiaceae bacterium]